MTTLKQVTLIAQPASLPPPLDCGYGFAEVSNDLAALFIPSMGLGARLPDKADCYIADIAVDGIALSQLVLLIKQDGHNIIAADWDKHLDDIAVWVENNLLTDLYSGEEQDSLSQEFVQICVLGLTQQLVGSKKND